MQSPQRHRNLDHCASKTPQIHACSKHFTYENTDLPSTSEKNAANSQTFCSNDYLGISREILCTLTFVHQIILPIFYSYYFIFVPFYSSYAFFSPHSFAFHAFLFAFVFKVLMKRIFLVDRCI